MPDVDVCINDCAAFSNLSFQVTGDTTCFPGWLWLMPGGTPSVYNFFEPPCVTYSTAGMYQVFLYGLDSVGDTTTINMQSFTVNVHAAPSAAFTATPTSLCINEAFNAQINNPSTMPGATYDWDMGDGNLYPFWSPIVNHIYTQPGTYTVSACVTDACGTDCQSQIVTVNEPKPRFSWVGTCKIYFTSDATCLGQIISHTWNFGDPSSGPNNTSTLANPIHLFTQNNVSYTVTHTIVTSNGTFSYTAIVTQTGPPIPVISGYQTNNCGNGFLTYTAANCTAGLVYTWIVTNGTPATDTGCSININWNTAGGQVILAAFDSIGDCTGYDTLVIPPCCIETQGNYVQIWNKSASEVLNDPAYAQYVSGTNFTSLNPVYINGVFTVDTTFTFLNCPSISFGANALTFTESGQTLTYDNTIVDGKCQIMWDGNYIEDATATLNIINGSIITQARKAVYSIDGGRYFIDNSKLRTNYKDIVVAPYGQTHLGIVRNTDFVMAGNFLQAIPALPFGHTKTVCGVEIEENADITIGDATNAIYQNRFTNILVGVRSINSVCTVVNANFTNLLPTQAQLANVPDAGTGIVATGRRHLPFFPSITVGGIGLRKCFFTNIRIGVDATQELDVDVQNNDLQKIRLYGIRVRDCQNNPITIVSNSISNQTAPNYNFNTGILVLECYGSIMNINYNTISQPTPWQYQNGTGIRIALVSPGDVTATVHGNVISKVKTGIHVQNLVGKDHVYITSNNITFTKNNNQYTTAHYGIRLEGCATVRCDTNRVSKNGPNPNASMVSNLRGVSIENSPVTYATDNIFFRMGSGIFGFEISTASTLACNTMNRCYHGVFFTGGTATSGACDIGDQVIDPLGTPSATGNTWIANVVPNQQILGIVSPQIIWRWDNVAPTAVGSGGVVVPGSATSYNACSQFFFQASQPVERDRKVGVALRSALDTTIGTEQRYQLHRYAHRKLTQTPSWLSLGPADDSLYQNFFNNYNPTNMGTLRQIEVAADTGNFQFVNTTCNTLACTNGIEHNLKVVYGIYSVSWMIGVLEFTSLDSATLLNIAMQDPVEGGTAVYSARVLLDLPIDYYGTSAQRMTQEENNSSVNGNLNIYPNPASSEVKLECWVEEDQVAYVEIFELGGKRILTQPLAPQVEVYTIETASLQGGIYLVRVVIEGEATEGKRLVIID